MNDNENNGFYPPSQDPSEEGSVDKAGINGGDAAGSENVEEETHNNKYADGEYSFTREEVNRRSYMDANFQPQTEHRYTSSYYTPPKKLEKKKKEKHRGGMVKFVCACLVCAILGGVGGGALVASQIPESTDSPSGNSLNINAGEPSSSPNPTKVSSGETLTGAQIYALGCEQAVGITTEITYRNYFGSETSTAVSGSGFIVTEDGYIVTNYHVIKAAHLGGYDVSVMLYNGETYPAEIVGFEEDKDIAVLKINASGLSAATLGSSENLLVGEDVFAIGNPLGELNFSMSSGTVSALNRRITTTDSSTNTTTTNNMFQIDAAVNEGNSGGPVYNDRGEVVGVVTAKYSQTGVEGLGFAIPIDDVVDIIEQLVEKGYVSGKPSFGITAETVDSASAQYFNVAPGAEVKSVNKGSCSEAAGLQVGDIITKLNDTVITSSNALVSTKKEYKAGDTVTLTVYRSGEYLELQVTLDEELPTVGNGSETDSDSGGKNLPTVPKS